MRPSDDEEAYNALFSDLVALEQARRELKYNPADVDAVIADLDRLILARDRKALTGPSNLWEPK